MTMNESGPKAGPDAVLDQARAQFAMMREALSALIARIRVGDGSDEKLIETALRAYSKSFQTTLDLEVDLEKRIKARSGAADTYAIDLDAARHEVRRRLAGLRGTAGDGGAA